MDWGQIGGMAAGVTGLLGLGTYLGSWVSKRDARLIQEAEDAKTVKSVPGIQTDMETLRRDSATQHREIMDAVKSIREDNKTTLESVADLRIQSKRDADFRHNLAGFLTTLLLEINRERPRDKWLVCPDLYRDPSATPVAARQDFEGR